MIRIAFDRPDVKQAYDKLPRNAAALAALELLGLESETIVPRVAEGKVGIHVVPLGRRQELVLGLDRKQPGLILLIMIEIRSRTRS